MASPTYKSLTAGAPLTILKPTGNDDYRKRMTSLLTPAPMTYTPPKLPAYSSFNSTPVSTRLTPAPVNQTRLPQPAPNQTRVPQPTPSQNNFTPAPVNGYNPAPRVATNTPAPTPAMPNAGGGNYAVRQGDTLGAIASRSGMTVQEIMRLNPNITDPNRIFAGQNITLKGATPTPTATQNPTATDIPTQNPTQTPTESPLARSFAENAGRAGLSYDEFSKLNLPTKEESDKIAQELGITALEGQLFKKPSETSQQIYDKAYNTAGLATVKKKLEKLYEDINNDREEARLAIGAIDENPFLTETSRVGRGKRALDQLEQKIGNKLEQAKQLEALYNTGIGEINSLITRNQTDFGINQQIDEAHLNYLQKKAEVQATQVSRSKVIKNSDDYFKGRASGEKPTTIGSAETGYYRWDATLGKFVQVTQPVTKAETFNPTAEQKGLVGRFINSAEGKKLGATAEDLAKAQEDPNFFYYLLQLADENGFY